MRIAITGSSGMIGTALRASLERDGHEVIRIVRSGASEPGTVRWDIGGGELDPAALEGLDGAVNLAGEPIGPRRWTDERKERIEDSRKDGTELLASSLAACGTPPPVLVSASGVDFYGDTGDDEITEDSPAGSGPMAGSQFLARVVHQWESATAPAAAAGIRVVNLRSGMVLDADEGSLAQMVSIFRFGVGGRTGSGRQWMSWISLVDEVRAIRFLLEHQVEGPVNATSPNPVTNATFTKALGRALHRPTILPTPAFAPMLLYGREMVEALLLASHRVLPERLTEEGFEFQDDDLQETLNQLLQ